MACRSHIFGPQTGSTRPLHPTPPHGGRLTLDPEIIRIWEGRAAAYDRLCHAQALFTLLSNRLIDMLPEDLQGAVLDIGAGSGLTSELLLARHPGC